MLPAEHLATIELAIQEQVTDLAALAGCMALPSEHPLRQGAASLYKAFQAVTNGPVSPEALTLAEVSRRSPLASWKMLVWAIASFYRREDETCRRYLDAIKPESAAARLLPAIRCMLDGKAGGHLPAASAVLVPQVTGNVLELKHALENLDRIFETEEDENRLLDAIRVAVRACSRNAPGQLERLKQHVSVRASLEDLDIDETRAAMGGPARRDAYFYRLFARGLEQESDLAADLISACAAWNDFRLKAVEEGWFAPNGVAVATLYLHMAELLKNVPEGTLHSFEQAARRNGQTSEDLFFIRAEKLYERACALDPHSEAFSQWIGWAKTEPGVGAEPVAEAWHKACPRDIEPILYLMAGFEGRGSFPTALQYLIKAERIDGLNLDVRKARLRLPAGNAIHCIQRKKHELAERSLEELAVLPQAPGPIARGIRTYSGCLRDSARSAEARAGRVGSRPFGPAPLALYQSGTRAPLCGPESLAGGIEAQVIAAASRDQLVSRFEEWLDGVLASEEAPEGIDAEILSALAADSAAGEDVRDETSSHALWAAMTALSQEVKLQGRAFKELTGALDSQGAQTGGEIRSAYRDRERDVQREAEYRCRKQILGSLIDLRDRLARGLDSAKASLPAVTKASRQRWLSRLFARRSMHPSEAALAAMVRGYELGLERLDQTLEDFHARPIRPLGQSFDPRCMNAIEKQDSNEVPEGTVVEVYRTGYEWNGEVFCPAQVKVSAIAKNAGENE